MMQAVRGEYKGTGRTQKEAANEKYRAAVHRLA